MSQLGKATGVSLPFRYRTSRRLLQLYLGLVLYAGTMALLIRAELGNMPWDVLHQGIARLTGLSFGTIAVIVGAAVLLLWIPLRQRPGLGTISNVVIIGLAADGWLAILPEVGSLPARIGYLVVGIGLNAVATSLYIGARFGPGPRDGLMTGLAARGHSLRLVRTAIEVAVVATGWLLGGTLGLGTIAYALTIGPLVHALLPTAMVTPKPDLALEPIRA